MIGFDGTYDEVAGQFAEQGIPTDQPGFYDHPNFLAVEQSNKAYIENYARFVATRPYEKEYLARARREIPLIAKRLHQEVVKDGRLGACVDASGVLSRILEREGLWNYQVKGALAIKFPPKSRLEPSYFWATGTGITAGHAWLYAPPFVVLDITIKQQPYRPRERGFLPEHVLAEVAQLGAGTAEEILDDSVRASLSRRGIDPKEQLRAHRPHLPRFLETFPAHSVRAGGTALKYITYAVMAPLESLEAMTAMSFSGRSGAEVYEQLIQPALVKARKSAAQ
jgi:hypothetical protein